MSNHLISTVYKRQLGTHMRKSVMALLADKASDDGSGIWAAKQTLADELCCSKQTVITTIQGFIADGLLHESGTRKCSTGSTVEYRIDVAKIEALPLVDCHAKRSSTLTGQEPLPVKSTEPSGQAAGPKPSRTIHEEEGETWAREIRSLPEWAAFKAMRRQIKKPLNPTAEKRIFAKLKNLADAGYPPGAVLEQSTAHCWQGVFPIEEEDGNDRRTPRPNGMGRHQPDGLSATTRAANRVFGEAAPSFGGSVPQ